MIRPTLVLIGIAFQLISSPGVKLLAQESAVFPKNYFRWPLDLPPAIVANMGEMRNNHWHMGLDIRTNQKENVPVYAAASGYISRIRVEKFGFGQSIFITHPNGFTTLYAHLNRFFPALEEYVRAQQYKKESWAIELDFPKDRFPVSKGQFIALSGNTGGSQGPHLHFEIRDSRTETCLNPQLFGMPLADQVKPAIFKLAMYDRSQSIYEQTTRYFPLKLTDSGYIVINSPVILTGSSRVGFAIQSTDRLSGSRNEDGIYAARLWFDDRPVISFVLDSVNYAKTRYLNAHIDYRYRFNGGPFFQHLSQLPGERSGVYRREEGDGVIELQDDQTHRVAIEVRDIRGNASRLHFLLRREGASRTDRRFNSQALRFVPNFVNVLEKPSFEAYLPETCLYDTLTSFYNQAASSRTGAISAVHQLNDPSVPVQGEMTIRIKPDQEVPQDRRDRVLLVRSYRDDQTVRKAQWNGEWLTARFGDFGFFQAFVDSEPPSLASPGRSDSFDLSGTSRIILEPKDNFDVIVGFRAELDGKWLRFTNDKGRYFVYQFDERCPYGRHNLRVRIEDLAGNVTEKNWVFTRYARAPRPRPAATKTVHKPRKAKKGKR